MKSNSSESSTVGSISAQFRSILILFFSLFVICSLFIYSQLFNLPYTDDNLSIIDSYTYILTVFALISFVLLVVYFHVKRYRLTRNALLIYIGVSFGVGLMQFMLFSHRMGDFYLIMTKLIMCLEIIYYLTILISKQKKSIGLTIFAIAGLALGVFGALSLSLDLNLSAKFSIYSNTLIYIPLIYAFYQEDPSGNTKPRSVENGPLDDVDF